MVCFRNRLRGLNAERHVVAAELVFARTIEGKD